MITNAVHNVLIIITFNQTHKQDRNIRRNNIKRKWNLVTHTKTTTN